MMFETWALCHMDKRLTCNSFYFFNVEMQTPRKLRDFTLEGTDLDQNHHTSLTVKELI